MWTEHVDSLAPLLTNGAQQKQPTIKELTVHLGKQHDQTGAVGLAASESQPEQQAADRQDGRRWANVPAKLCCAFGHVADGEGCCVIHKAHLQVQTQC